jgi:dimethylhistidine N-methyltransferase
MDEFSEDTWRGLSSEPKYLQSKFFYDAKGDALFREIMDCPEYYLTRCELEIFQTQSNDIAKAILGRLNEFDIVELGPGDATKSVYLLEALANQNALFTYFPIDISGNVIDQLNLNLPKRIPGIKIKGLKGDYLEMLGKMKHKSTRNKVVLFLGSNIGNIPLNETTGFLMALKACLAPGDLLLTGFDLKKDPAVILAAYNDATGITRKFNLNLLQRINDTLGADFILSLFEHQPEYDESKGACKSYLVSLKEQVVHISNMGIINFSKGERIFMEVSQKYSVEQTDEIATGSGFIVYQHFQDNASWFLDALWGY